MNIITRNSDNVVLFAEQDITLGADGVYGDSWVYNGLNNITATLSTDVTLPDGFLLGAWSYVAGTWTITDTVSVNDLAAQNLQAAQTAQVAILYGSYLNAITQSVNFTSAGAVTKTYQADPESVQNLIKMILAFQKAGVTPAAFAWTALDNSHVPFTFADMQGLAAVMGEQGWLAYQHLQIQKGVVMAATTVSAVQSITF